MASRPQAGHMALRPDIGQGRQQVQFTGVALQQHLGDPGGGPVVAVDLEGWVRPKEISIYAAAIHNARFGRHQIEDTAQNFISSITILQSGPLIDLPTHRPAGGHVAAQFQRLAGGVSQFGRMLPGNLTARM
jgi:hypothetical protein